MPRYPWVQLAEFILFGFFSTYFVSFLNPRLRLPNAKASSQQPSPWCHILENVGGTWENFELYPLHFSNFWILLSLLDQHQKKLTLFDLIDLFRNSWLNWHTWSVKTPCSWLRQTVATYTTLRKEYSAPLEPNTANKTWRVSIYSRRSISPTHKKKGKKKCFRNNNTSRKMKRRKEGKKEGGKCSKNAGIKDTIDETLTSGIKKPS